MSRLCSACSMDKHIKVHLVLMVVRSHFHLECERILPNAKLENICRRIHSKLSESSKLSLTFLQLVLGFSSRIIAGAFCYWTSGWKHNQVVSQLGENVLDWGQDVETGGESRASRVEPRPSRLKFQSELSSSRLLSSSANREEPQIRLHEGKKKIILAEQILGN